MSDAELRRLERDGEAERLKRARIRAELCPGCGGTLGECVPARPIRSCYTRTCCACPFCGSPKAAQPLWVADVAGPRCCCSDCYTSSAPGRGPYATPGTVYRRSIVCADCPLTDPADLWHAPPPYSAGDVVVPYRPGDPPRAYNPMSPPTPEQAEALARARAQRLT